MTLTLPLWSMLDFANKTFWLLSWNTSRKTNLFCNNVVDVNKWSPTEFYCVSEYLINCFRCLSPQQYCEISTIFLIRKLVSDLGKVASPWDWQDLNYKFSHSLSLYKTYSYSLPALCLGFAVAEAKYDQIWLYSNDNDDDFFLNSNLDGDLK